MKARLAIVALVMVAVGTADAVDMNSPAPRTITIGSEIQRGAEAAGQCSPKLEPGDYVACIDGIVGRAAENATNDDPFMLGMFLAAWTTVDVDVRVDEMFPNVGPPAASGVSALEWASSEFRRMRAFQAKLGVSDDQLVETATKLLLGSSDFRQRLAYYRQHAPPL
jgi:hypothetical protein